MSVLVSMGSNIEPARNLLRAVDELAARLEVSGVSRVFETEPVGARAVPTFLNAAVEVETELSPVQLKFGVLRWVEAALGRVRSADRNAPRTIDLDIAFFGDLIVSVAAAGITIPDPDVLRYAHVAMPLADLAPDRRHPETGRRLVEIAAGLESADRVRPAHEADVLKTRLQAIGSARRPPRR